MAIIDLEYVVSLMQKSTILNRNASNAINAWSIESKDTQIIETVRYIADSEPESACKLC